MLIPMILLVLFVYRNAEIWEPGELREPFVQPLNKPLGVGDTIYIEGILDADSGFKFDLTNKQEINSYSINSTKDFVPELINLLHIVVNEPALNNTLVIDSYVDGFLNKKKFNVTVPTNTYFTVEIGVTAASFTIALHMYVLDTFTVLKFANPHPMPLALGRFVRLEPRVENEGIAKIIMVEVQREKSTFVYVPRLNSPSIANEIRDHNMAIMKEKCKPLGNTHRPIYMQYNGLDDECTALTAPPPDTELYLELFPCFYKQCPGALMHDPKKFVVLRVLQELELKEVVQTVLIADWSWMHDLVFTGNGDFRLEFFKVPAEGEKCAIQPAQPTYFVNSSQLKNNTVLLHTNQNMTSFVMEDPVDCQANEISKELIGSVRVTGHGKFTWKLNKRVLLEKI